MDETGVIVIAVVASAVALFAILDWWSRPAAFPVRGAVVVITGGSSGIGKSVAAECLRKGASVALLARTQSLLDSAYPAAPRAPRAPALSVSRSCVIPPVQAPRRSSLPCARMRPSA